VHIRDVYFSRYLDRPGLTLLHFYPQEGEVTYDIPFKWSLPTRLRKLFRISVYFPCPLTCTRNMTSVTETAAAPDDQRRACA
jgi:hypothetical protein